MGSSWKVLWKTLSEELKDLIDSSENGRIMKEGIQTVILGKPNAGKSSLLNVLSGRERAIVTDIEGTTQRCAGGTDSDSGAEFEYD